MGRTKTQPPAAPPGKGRVKCIYTSRLQFYRQSSICTSDPMDNKRGNRNVGGPRNFGGPREMTKAICSDCGKECEVPFKPTEGRPVYCQDCLPKHRKPRF